MEPDGIDKSIIAISVPPKETTPRIESAAQQSTQNGSTMMPLNTSNETASKQEVDEPKSPQITHALEALLGGLEPPTAKSDVSSAFKEVLTNESTRVNVPERKNEGESIQDDIRVESALRVEDQANPELSASNFESHPAPESTPILESTDIHVGEDAEVMGGGSVETHVQRVSEVTDTQMSESLEIAEPVPAISSEAAEGAVENTDTAMGEEVAGEKHPEWEVDSSPIESSSDDSSDDSSSEESDEGDNAYKLLSPEEQARILMAGDGGSDDEGGAKSKGAGGQLRTKNEVPEVVIPKPDVTITPEMPILELGTVEAVVENIALIKGKTSGEYRVLESGSVLCLEDRSVIGVVAEPLGRVQQPLYSVLFTNIGAIQEAGLSVGTKVFYSELHTTYVFTQTLKAFKGSDASNLHDEEVGDEEMEFSDDEAEIEHKKRVKQKRSEKHGARMRDAGSSRGGHPLQQQHDASTGIGYDEADDGPYKPLARPRGLASSIGHGEAPQEATYPGGQSRDQFRGRGKGDRGRGRGDRGRGRGGFQSRGGVNNGYSQPLQNRPTSPQHSPTLPFTQNPFQATGHGHPQIPQATPNFYNTSQQYSPNQPLMPAWPQFPPQPPFHQQTQQYPYQQQGFQQAFQNMQHMSNGWPNMPPNIPTGPPIPAGAFINPAFFGNSQNQAGNDNLWSPHGKQGPKGAGGK